MARIVSKRADSPVSCSVSLLFKIPFSQLRETFLIREVPPTESHQPRDISEKPSRHTTRRTVITQLGLTLAGAAAGFAGGHIVTRRASRPPGFLSATEMFERFKRSVVIISTGDSFGTGFCIDRLSLDDELTSVIATADHVTDGHKISSYRQLPNLASIVTSSGETAPIGTAYVRDGMADLVLFSCRHALEPIPVAPSPPAVGEQIYTIGHPSGEKFTLSSGIVSGYVLNDSPRMRITAPVSPGSSGGPVMNRRGQVVGVVSSLAKDSQNLNYVVPISEILAALSRLRILEIIY